MTTTPLHPKLASLTGFPSRAARTSRPRSLTMTTTTTLPCAVEPPRCRATDLVDALIAAGIAVGSVGALMSLIVVATCNERSLMPAGAFALLAGLARVAHEMLDANR